MTTEVIGRLQRLLAEARPIVKEAGGTRADAALSRFREGFTLEPQLRQELRDLGFQGTDVDKLIIVARLIFDTDYRSELITVYRTAFQNDLITLEELRTALEAIIARPERVDNIINIEYAKKLPETKLPTLAELKAAYLADIITENQYRSELEALELPPDRIELIIALAILAKAKAKAK